MAAFVEVTVSWISMVAIGGAIFEVGIGKYCQVFTKEPFQGSATSVEGIETGTQPEFNTLLVGIVDRRRGEPQIWLAHT